ncbi:membrane protein insertase YidC [Streptomyces sp. NPDC021093]|uniref:membrane protein insertase YidC n=1 Tax=Streptomyces sp. NPDC021093 TaxID=3365112 RepID=UPI0037A1A474
MLDNVSPRPSARGTVAWKDLRLGAHWVTRGSPYAVTNKGFNALDWLYHIVSMFLNWIHSGLRMAGFDGGSGWAWAGAIVLLTVFLRILLLPLYIKQAKATRRLQQLTPKVQQLRAKHADDKQLLNQELMRLYRSEGSNPLVSCLPMVVQIPVFIGLVQVLHRISEAAAGQDAYATSAQLVHSAQHANVFGAHISDTFLRAMSTGQGAAITVTALAVVISSCSTFLSVRASTRRQKATQELSATPAVIVRSQKILLVLAPMFGIVGLALPVGVLLYWVTSNCWNLVQQNLIHRLIARPEGPRKEKMNDPYESEAAAS